MFDFRDFGRYCGRYCAIVFLLCCVSAQQAIADGDADRDTDGADTDMKPMMTQIHESGGVSLPSARLEFQSSSYGFIVGVSQGSGTLTYQEEAFPFSLKGYSVGMIGGASVDAIGVVYDLNDVGDFPGNYSILTGSFTAFQGGGSARYKNDKGVTIEVQMLQKGAELSLGAGRIEIAFEPQS